MDEDRASIQQARLDDIIVTAMASTRDLLERLQAGNRRFVKGDQRLKDATSSIRRASLRERQEPFAVILGCSDSRVPPEVIFDQGLGDLFVVRVAGNIVEPSQMGSVEFAVESFGISLVVVLGHSKCGAVAATLGQLLRPSPNLSPNLQAIVERIRPAVESLLPRAGGKSLLEEAVLSNVKMATHQLREESVYLKGLVSQSDLMIVGAHYSLETGEVEFLVPS